MSAAKQVPVEVLPPDLLARYAPKKARKLLVDLDEQLAKLAEFREALEARLSEMDAGQSE